MPNEEMGHRVLPQSPEVATRTVVFLGLGFLGFVALSMAVLFLYLKLSAPGAFVAVQEATFPQPALQDHPREDYKRFEEQQRAELSGYAWVERSKGLARIPIDEAMRRIIARGAHAYDPLDPSPAAAATTGSSGARP